MIIGMSSIMRTSACLMVEERLDIVQRSIEQRDGRPLWMVGLDLRGNLFGATGS
jgi:hypothetical protein